MPVRLLLSIVVVLVYPVALAQADQGTLRDARGDARPAWDITRLVADNGLRKLRIQVHYRGRLRPKYGLGLLTNVKIDLGYPAEDIYDADYAVDLLRGSPDPRAPNRFDLVRYDGDYDVDVIRCPGFQLRVRYGRGLLEFVIPQRCFGALSGPVRLSGHTYTPRGTADKADYIDYWGPWVDQG